MRSNLKNGSKKRALSYKSIQMSHLEEADSDQALLNQIMKLAGSQEMLLLLGAYDEVVKNKVPQAQATRIYRQLLKINREQSDFTFVNQQHVSTFDTLEPHTTEGSTDHFKSVESQVAPLKRHSSV